MKMNKRHIAKLTYVVMDMNIDLERRFSNFDLMKYFCLL